MCRFLLNLRERRDQDAERQRREELHTSRRKAEEARTELQRQRLMLRDRIERERMLSEKKKQKRTAVVRKLREKLKCMGEEHIYDKAYQSSVGDHQTLAIENGRPTNYADTFLTEPAYPPDVVHQALVPPEIRHRVKLQPPPRPNPRPPKSSRRKPVTLRPQTVKDLPEGADLAVELPKLFPGLRGFKAGRRLVESTGPSMAAIADSERTTTESLVRQKEDLRDVHSSIMAQLGKDMRWYKSELEQRLADIMQVAEAKEPSGIKLPLALPVFRVRSVRPFTYVKSHF
ncbi:hypothetical protein FOZ62_014873 [Perkinsus olseni]|uniref:Uncharacterized protein n=1 Tax=Perkinsus olseni TaxID=32597 RepID=A0A7J6U165_PEROL|nr:hypothetical protein FOZ62_014873 [Perkinsus olseni]